MNISHAQQDTPLVLIVDDDKFMRLQLRQMVEQAGYQVIEAADGVAAVAAYKRHQPQMVLLDAVMPKMDGFTCCRELHTLLDRDRPAIVLMITQVGDPASVNRAFEVGATDYITKPVHQTILCQRIQRLLRENQLTRALQQEVVDRRQAEAKLKAITAELQRSNHELQNFASVASHDLQEPLRKIQIIGERLKSTYGETLTNQGRDYVERMQQAATRMNSLIQDLLAFSRLTSQTQSFKSVDLTQVVQGVLSDLEIRIEHSGGHVEVSNLPTLVADPTQMRQLLQNLISNGLKFSKPGQSPVVKVQGLLIQSQSENTAGLPSAPELCQIRITDNGIGFDEKHLGRIFKIFQRLHGRNEYEGTGVGLAVCQKIAERHGGTITATSTPGQGATFIVTLPSKQPNSPSPA